MGEPNGNEWHWYQVRFDLGMPSTEDFPTDPLEFLKMLLDERVKYVGGLVVRSAVLTTKPS